MLGHPVWVVSTLLLGIVVRLQRRGRWEPHACTVRLQGKTAIVTGANTGMLRLNVFIPMRGVLIRGCSGHALVYLTLQTKFECGNNLVGEVKLAVCSFMCV